MGWVEGVLQAKLEAADPEGWRYLEAWLEDPGADSWGGKGELGLVLTPLRLEGLLLTRVVGEGLGAAPRLDFDLARPQLVYGSRLDQAANSPPLARFLPAPVGWGLGKVERLKK